MPLVRYVQGDLVHIYTVQSIYVFEGLLCWRQSGHCRPKMFSWLNTKPSVVNVKLKDSGGVLWDPRNVGEYLNCSGLRRLPDFVPDHVEDPSGLTDKWLDFSNHKQLKWTETNRLYVPFKWKTFDYSTVRQNAERWFKLSDRPIIVMYIPLKSIAHKDSIKSFYFLLLNLVL